MNERRRSALQKNFDLCIPRKGIFADSVPYFPIFTFVCLRAIYIFPRSVHLFSCSRIYCTDRSWEYINRSQKHECRTCDCGSAVPFLGIFVSNFQFCVFAVCGSSFYARQPRIKISARHLNGGPSTA
jgi:hypothetical protein